MTTGRPDLPAGTVTLFFSDVEGSTSLLHQMGPEPYAEALAGHRRILRAAFARHGGMEIDTQGDAFFAVFNTAAGALAAAAEVQDALAPGAIRVRIGIHTGVPHRAEEGYVGVDVHKGARIAAAGHGGQVLLSQETYAQVVGTIPPAGWRELRDLGEHRLKDFAEPTRLFQFGSARFPPLRTISNTNLPHPASSFVGRKREVADVVGLLNGRARLVTLTGPGGAGKTRLAIEAAAELLPEFTAGVFWVDLASLRDPALVIERIAQTLGAKDELAAHIADRELLLLLDNLEQVIAAAPSLSSLLAACANLRLLVTSRELLRVQGEVEFRVPPLEASDAVRLFCERARVEPSQHIVELCARLDYLPLAVELAAARTRALSPAQILARLSRRLDLLTGGRDADRRQQTLRAAIDWSFDLLPPNERQVFARLSVFAGGCTLEAVEHVVGAGVDELQSLVEKSLLRFSNERYGMLETIREYAAEVAEASGGADALRRRHAAWALVLAEAAAPELHGPAQLVWLDRLDHEHENLRAALSWTLWNDPQVGGRLAAALSWFWQLRSHLGEGEYWLEEALRRAGDGPVEVHARLLQGLGQLTYYKDGIAEAARLLDDAVDLWRRTDARRSLAESLAYLGIAAGESGHPERAREAGEESIAVARSVGDPWTLGFVLWARGATRVLGTSGPMDLAGARPLLEESVTLLRPTGDRWALAAPLFYLGEIAAAGGDIERAFDLIGHAATLIREIGDKWRLANALTRLAKLSEGRGDTSAAVRLQEEAEIVKRELGRLREADPRSA